MKKISYKFKNWNNNKIYLMINKLLFKKLGPKQQMNIK